MERHRSMATFPQPELLLSQRNAELICRLSPDNAFDSKPLRDAFQTTDNARQLEPLHYGGRLDLDAKAPEKPLVATPMAPSSAARPLTAAMCRRWPVAPGIGPAIETRRLAARSLASAMLLFGLCLCAWANPPPEGAHWNIDRSAAVAATPGSSGTRVTAYLQQPDGTFLEIDLSAVENRNFGKLGRSAAAYDSFETKPIEWLPRQDGLLQIRIQTQAWRSGKRYTVTEPLIFRPDGTVMWR